jgi:N-glycosylase/DNA lyase
VTPAVPKPQSRACTRLEVRDYDIAATLDSGQAFRWARQGDAWTGIVGRRWVRLRPAAGGIEAEAHPHGDDWTWLRHYLQLDVDLEAVLSTFPPDEPMQASVRACRGLRLLRQDPWECLASFILSSTKQIVQIRQICELLCERYGEAVGPPDGIPPRHAFPSAARLACCSELELRACKMGFRAPSLLAAARAVDSGALDLESLQHRNLEEARQALCALHGVGTKIANCVLLFSCGHPRAFPVDVWVRKAIRELYFPRRKPTPARLERFVESHFGPHAGYAQQYLFHYRRTIGRRPSPSTETLA